MAAITSVAGHIPQTTNFSTYGKRRVALQSGVSYGDNLEHVKRVALEEINKLPHIAKNTEIEFYFLNIGSYSYNFEVRFWIYSKRFYCSFDVVI